MLLNSYDTQQSGYCTVMAPSLGEKAKWLQALAKQQESKHRDATRAHSEKSKPVSTQVYTYAVVNTITATIRWHKYWDFHNFLYCCRYHHYRSISASYLSSTAVVLMIRC
jgi:hypothetical protein